jgi:molybdopterin-guanine dinucleotide biosynthesis protein A
VIGEAAAAPLGGIILAGGQSRRMGQPKALLRLTPTGPTLIELALAALHTVAAEVIVVTNTPASYAFLGCRMAADQFPGLGALAGIQAGLAASVHAHNMVVACDMPFLNPALLAALAAEPRDYDVLIPRRADGELETLHAIYSRACLGPITEQLRAGGGRVIGFYPQVRVRYLDEPWLRRYDPALRSFDNVNTPAELAAARGGLPPAVDHQPPEAGRRD